MMFAAETVSARPQNIGMTLHEVRPEQKRSFSENSFGSDLIFLW
jgi:hypothetical protein